MKFDHDTAHELAKCMVLRCFRNGEIENLHAGKYPDSEMADYSDVKVVTPSQEIPWSGVAKLSDDDMRLVMTEAVNKMYSFLINMHDEAFLEKSLRFSQRYTQHWDAPELIDNF